MIVLFILLSRHYVPPELLFLLIIISSDVIIGFTLQIKDLALVLEKCFSIRILLKSM